MEELDKVKSIRKVRMKSGAKYLFVFRIPHLMSMDEYDRLALRISAQGKRLEKKMEITFEAMILDDRITLDVVEKEK